MLSPYRLAVEVGPIALFVPGAQSLLKRHAGCTTDRKFIASAPFMPVRLIHLDPSFTTGELQRADVSNTSTF